MMRIMTRVGMFIGCLGIAATAWGQHTQSWVPRSMSTENERSSDEIILSITGFTEYNDNRRPTRTNRKSTIYSGVGPRIGYKASFPEWGFSINYNPMYTWWVRRDPGTHKYEWTHALALNGHLDLTGRTMVNAENRFWYTKDPTIYLTYFIPNDEGMLAEGGEKWDMSHYDNRTTLGLVHFFSDRFRADASATYRLLKYVKKPGHRMYNLDEQQFMSSLNLWHQVTFSFDGGLNFSYNRYMRDSSGDTDTNMDMDTYSAGLIGNYKLAGGWDLRASWGYQWIK